jgi:hypothetical protein
MSSVWVQLYYKGETTPVGEVDPIEIEPMPKNVNALKVEVKAAKLTKLNHVDAGDLSVYASGTAVPIPKDAISLHSWENVPHESTGPLPLIVVAPKPEQQNGKLRCCFCIVVFKCCFEYENEFNVVYSFLYSSVVRIRK